MRTRLMSFALMCLLLWGIGGPAVAGTPGIGLSFDGVHWGQSLDRPLFDSSVRWVPGDTGTASFFVRNQAASHALLAISVRARHQANLLESRDIHLQARAGGDWFDLTRGARASTLNTRALPVGEAVRVQIRAVFDPQSTNQSMSRSSLLTFLVTLYDARAGGGSVSSGSGTDSGGLPGTGSPVRPLYLWIGAMLVGAGFALTRRSRKETTA